MATAKWNKKGGITLKMTTEEATAVERVLAFVLPEAAGQELIFDVLYALKLKVGAEAIDVRSNLGGINRLRARAIDGKTREDLEYAAIVVEYDDDV